MRNFKKRIVSFVSAIALAATILPGAELFASAADTVLSLKNNVDFTYDYVESNKFIDNSQNYQAGIAGTRGLSKSNFSFTNGTTYTFTIEVGLKAENKTHNLPTLYIQGTPGGDTNAGSFGTAEVTQAMQDNHSSLPDGYSWSNDGGFFVCTKSITYTATETASRQLRLQFFNDDRDKIGFKSLTISDSAGGGDSSSVADSSSQGESSSQGNSPVTITSGTIVKDNWDQNFPVDLTGYSSATLVISNYTDGSDWLKAAYNDWEHTFFQEGAKGETTVDLTSLCGQSFTLKLGANGARTFTITGVRSASSSSQGESSYTITTEASPAEGGTVTGGGSYASGSSVTLEATANSGYTFTKWQKDGEDIAGATSATYTIASVAAADAGTYTAVFTAVPNTYTVTFSGTNGSVTATANGNPINSGASVPAGTSVTFTAEPDSGYTFTSWSDGSTSNPYTKTINENTTLTATFTAVPTTYTVNFSGTNGTVTATAGGNAISSGDSVAEGTSVTFTATPSSGYEFTQWDDGDTTNPRTVTISDNTTMTATFTAQSSGEVLITSLTSSESGGGRHTLGTVDFTNYTNVRFEMTSTNTQYGFNRLYINGSDHYFGDTSSRSGKLDGTESYTDVTGLSDVLFEYQGQPTTTITFYGVRVGGGEDPVTYPLTVNALENGEISPDFKVISGDTIDRYFAENNYINSYGLSNGTRAGLPFYIDDTSADVTYTISVYLKGQGDTWACIFNGATTDEICGGKQVNAEWTKLDSDPAVFTLKGSDFPSTGTYYAGFAVSANDSLINLLKVVVEKSGGSQAEVEYEVVGPHRSGDVSVNGTTLTATPRSEYQFVGWYDNAACTGNALSTSSTYTYNGTKVYAKFDYVAYNLPIIDIVTSTNDGSFDAAWAGLPKSTSYEGSKITIANSEYELPVDTVTIKGRGNSTWALNKKPFELKFGSKVSLFGNGEENKTWILLANHADRTLIRNQLAYDWARTALTGIPFTTTVTPVEVYVNGDYQGMYIVVEKSRVGKGRVEIEETSETTSDMSQIGFLAEWDKLAEKNGVPKEDYYIKTNVPGFSEFFTLHSGVYSTYENGEDFTTSGGNNTNTTAIAIGQYLNTVSAAMMSGDEATIRSYVDMDSLVDMFILQEFTKNPDCGGSSFYMYKNKGVDSKLTFGPPWDFDKALGDEIRVTQSDRLYINGGDPASNGNKDNVNTWFASLYGHQWFKDLVVARWHDLRSDSTNNPDNLTDQIDSFVSSYSASAERNYRKWSYDMTHQFDYNVFWGDYGLSGDYFGGQTTFAGQTSALKRWILDRIAFLDIEWSGNAVTINAEDYNSPEFKYNDGGSQPAIPFVVTNPNGNVTEHDIIVTMNYTGSDKWVNVFTPVFPEGLELRDGFGANTATGDGDQYGVANSFSDLTGGITIQKHAIQRSGPFTFVIPAGSPTGTYLAGVSGADSFDSITVRYVDDDGIQEFGTASEYTFTYEADANGSVTATYDVDGTPTPVVSGSILPRGTVVTLTATPDEGYEFRGWAENGSIVSTDSTRTITVNRNVDTTAKFVEEGAVFSLTLTANDHIESATGDMTKVDTVYKVPQGGYEGNLVSVPFYLSEDATVTIDVSAWLSGNPDGWTKFELYDINGIALTPAVELVLDAQHNENGYRDGTREKIYTFSAELPKGEYRFGMYGKEWDSFTQVTLSTEEPNLLSLDAPVGEALNPAPIFRVNKDAYGYTSKAKPGDTYYVDEKVTAVAREGYMFVNWSILVIDDKGNESIVPIDQAEGFNGVNARNKVLSLTAAMVGKTIYANFGEKQSVRYEAENFVELVSEGYIIPKQTLKDQGVPEEEWVEHKMSNAEFYGRTWDNHSTARPYDAPKVVRDGESRENYPGEAEPVYQVWDNSDYTDHKVVTSGYSGGKAVALTGPTSGVAIPFTVTEDLLDDFTFALGYNYGDMPTNYTNGGGSRWYDEDLYVNIYATAKLTEAQENALKSKGWSLSGYAKPDYASDAILADAKVGTVDGGLQTAFNKRLPINSLNWQTNNNDDPRQNVQEAEVTLPAGLPAGKYYISVATDHSNLFADDAAGRQHEYFNDANEGNYTGTGTVGTAYYDYIEFYTAATPEYPSPITVGANFNFVDMFGNTLMTNDFKQATFNPDTHQIVFSPTVPRYLRVQGYKIDYWMYTVNDVTNYVLPDGTISDEKPTLSDLDTADTNEQFRLLAECIEKLSFPQGSNITFTAHYVVKNDVYDMTVDNGRVYVMESVDDENPALLPKGQVYQVSNYGIVKLVANPDSDARGKFQYWTLNDQIYSYEREVIFTAWCGARFEAVFDEVEQKVSPAAFINEKAEMFGFESPDRKYHKITFECAFYIPNKNDFISCGIIYSPYAANIADLSGVTVTDYGTLTNLPEYTAIGSADYDQLFEKANHQVLISLAGVKNDTDRSARAFYIYNDNGTNRVVFSDNTTTVHTPVATQD